MLYFAVDRGRSISIHAPREGGDRSANLALSVSKEFQSTPPARGATAGVLICQWHNSISIHAPREGGRLPPLTTG